MCEGCCLCGGGGGGGGRTSVAAEAGGSGSGGVRWGGEGGRWVGVIGQECCINIDGGGGQSRDTD